MGVSPHLPSIPRLQMVEYKSARDVETFSKFLENGGTLPKEPPAVSEVPPPQGQGPPHPPHGSSQSLLGRGMDPAGWGQAGAVCPSMPHCCLLQVPETPENSTDREEPSPPGTAETRDEL